MSFHASHERRDARRLLRIESCEERNLLAVDLAGTKFNDLTGNGFSVDDPPLAGVTIQLYQDNGDGTFDPNVDTLFDSKVTAANGTYTFSAVPDGHFYIREIPPAGSTQTGGPAFYDIDIVNGAAYAGTHLVVDDFELPDPASSYVINLFDPDPTLIKNSAAGILGGQRDVLIDVFGNAGATTIFGTVGQSAQGGTFVFGSSFPAVEAILQYDGSDADIVGPPASLVNNLGLSTDLTGGGVNTGFRFDFNQVQVPGAPTSMDVQIHLTSTGGGTADFSGNIPEDPINPQSFFAGFGNFATGGGFSFANVTSITISFNTAAVADIDFVLDNIVVDKPQSRLFDFANFFDGQQGGAQVAIDKVTDDDGTSGDGLTILSGEPISWIYTVTNPGDVSLFNVTVTDNQPGVTPVFVGGDTNGNGRLDPGESWVYTANGTSIVGQYNNTGTVVASPFDTGQGPVTDSDPSDYFGIDPQIAIDKVTVDGALAGDGLTILTGESISWRYTVTNLGNVPLANVSVVDSHAGVTPVFVSGDTNGNNLLDLTESWIYQANGTAITGAYNNIGTATGDVTDDADHTRTVTDTDPSNYVGVDPQIAINKVTVDGGSAGDGLTILSGESIKWRYTVTNVGTVPLSNVTVTDNQAGVTPTFVSGDTNANNILDLTETWIYEANGTAITGTYNNIGTANGQFTDTAGHTRIDTATDPSNYIGVNPQIAIDKVTVDGANVGDDITVIAGTAIKWRYTVTNTGTVPLSNVTVTDNQAGVTPTFVSGDTNANNLLDLTETWIYEASGTAIVGNYNNIGTASGSFTDTAEHTRQTTDTDPSNYFGAEPISSISGFVYVDVNNDGFFSPAEMPIQNVTVTLTSTDNLPLVTATTLTNASGFYIFSNLRPGTYKIVETQPVQFIDGKDTIGTPGGTTSNDMFSNIVLPADFDGENNNFGELGLSQPSKQYLVYPAIHPTDRFDVNGDGVVGAADVLQVVNSINATSSGKTASALAQPNLDVNQDGRINSLDVVQLVNRINTPVVSAPIVTARTTSVRTASAQSAPSISAQASSDIAAGIAADQAISQLTASSSGAATADSQVTAQAASSKSAAPENTGGVLVGNSAIHESVWGDDVAASDDLFNLI